MGWVKKGSHHLVSYANTMTAKTIDHGLLTEVLDYDPETGLFTWKVSRSRMAKRGSRAGTVTKEGYVRVNLAGKQYLAHRLAWFYVHKEWPENQIDHADGDKQNNSIVNLRDVDGSLNCQNQRVAKASNVRSGLLGVTWHNRSKRWAAEITSRGVRKHLGYFSNAEDAHQAYVAEKRKQHLTCTI